jgi:extracellular elastinolytic metalloproteinase
MSRLTTKTRSFPSVLPLSNLVSILPELERKNDSSLKLAYIPPSDPSVSLESAALLAEQALGGRLNSQPPTLEYLALDDNTAALAHVFQIQNENAGVWKEAFVDAHSGKL